MMEMDVIKQFPKRLHHPLSSQYPSPDLLHNSRSINGSLYISVSNSHIENVAVRESLQPYMVMILHTTEAAPDRSRNVAKQDSCTEKP